VSHHWPEEPVARLRSYLTRVGAWGREQEESLLHECGQQVEQAAADYIAEPPLPITALFDRTYATMPVDLADQLHDATARAAGAA
jgi:pyruvate dehydrogenase E1 component alpha subunit